MTGVVQDCAHVLDLGGVKPMGYLPLSYFSHWTLLTAKDAEEMAAARGLRTRRFAEAECQVGSGALYAWSPCALGDLLARESDILTTAGWPTDPDGFVMRVAREHVADAHPVRRIIALAFGAPWEIAETHEVSAARARRP